MIFDKNTIGLQINPFTMTNMANRGNIWQIWQYAANTNYTEQTKLICSYCQEKDDFCTVKISKI